MSRNEWERGSFILPSAEWVKFRKGFINAYNNALLQDIATVTRIHEAVKAAIKGKRGVDLTKVVRETIHRVKPGGRFGAEHENLEFPLTVINPWNAESALLKKDEVTGKVKLQAPKKASFKLAKQDAKSFSAGGEAHVGLDNAKREVTWDVSENNHACDRARETFLGKLLFKLLREVKWGRGSGGAIRGNDEYHEDAGKEYSGGGGSYLKDRFGPLGDQEYENVHGFKPAPRAASPVRRPYGYMR